MHESLAVIGLGNWGTALAEHLCRNGLQVLGWSKDQEVVDGINQSHVNPLALSDIKLSKSLSATSDLGRAIGSDLIILSFSSKALHEMLPKLKSGQFRTVVSVIKGLEEQSLSTPLQSCERILSSEVSLAVLSGPSFARDIIERRPSGVVCASSDLAVAQRVAELFTSESMKVYVSIDPLGVELGGTLKNVIALAAGISDGLGLGDSARAGLITRGLAEMMRLAKAMGADPQTLSGLSGLGDLTMTASSDLSRNRTVGKRLAQGQKLTEIIRTLGSVAEGVSTAPLVERLAHKYKVEMPITFQVARLLRGECDAVSAVRELMNRPIRAEFDS